MSQLAYTMFISNNHPSFHLRWKENLVKHQIVPKYYENDCSQVNNWTQSTVLVSMLYHWLFPVYWSLHAYGVFRKCQWIVFHMHPAFLYCRQMFMCSILVFTGKKFHSASIVQLAISYIICILSLWYFTEIKYRISSNRRWVSNKCRPLISPTSLGIHIEISA